MVFRERRGKWNRKDGEWEVRERRKYREKQQTLKAFGKEQLSFALMNLFI